MNFKERLQSIITGRPKRVMVTMHKRPDGDALGSALAFGRLLAAHGHDVEVVSPTVYPQFLGWMPGIDAMLIAEKMAKRRLKSIIERAEVIVCLDFAEYHRLGIMADDVRKAGATKIVIDHHPMVEEPMSDLWLCLPDVAATAMLIYDLLIELGLYSSIDRDIATCLYVGVVTDTGFFGHSNVNAHAHMVAAKLLEHGIDLGYIHYQLTSNVSLHRLRFIAHAIERRLVVLPKEHLAYFAIPREDVGRFNLQSGDTGGMILYALNLHAIYIAGLLTEQKDSVHMSLRSFGNLPVNKLAAAHFSGGGHTNAAGGISFGSLEQTGKKLEKVSRELIRDYALPVL